MSASGWGPKNFRLALEAHGPLPIRPRVVSPSYAQLNDTMKAFKSKITKEVNKIFREGDSKATGNTGSIDPPSRPQSSFAIRPSVGFPGKQEKAQGSLVMGEYLELQQVEGRFRNIVATVTSCPNIPQVE